MNTLFKQIILGANLNSRLAAFGFIELYGAANNISSKLKLILQKQTGSH